MGKARLFIYPAGGLFVAGHSLAFSKEQRLMLFMTRIVDGASDRFGDRPAETTTPRMQCGSWEVRRLGTQQAPPLLSLPLEERSHSQEAARGGGGAFAEAGGVWFSLLREQAVGDPALTGATLSRSPSSHTVSRQVKAAGSAGPKAGRRWQREGRGVDGKVELGGTARLTRASLVSTVRIVGQVQFW